MPHLVQCFWIVPIACRQHIQTTIVTQGGLWSSDNSNANSKIDGGSVHQRMQKDARGYDVPSSSCCAQQHNSQVLGALNTAFERTRLTTHTTDNCKDVRWLLTGMQKSDSAAPLELNSHILLCKRGSQRSRSFQSLRHSRASGALPPPPV